MDKINVLHLLDDEKFTDTAISLFNECEGITNDYLIGVEVEPPKMKYVKSKVAHIKKNFSRDYNEILLNPKYNLIVVHYLNYHKALAITMLNAHAKVLWLMWGGDFYNTSLFNGPLYQEHTKRLVREIKLKTPYKSIVRPFLVDVAGMVFPRNRLYRILIKKAIQRVDYCATVIPTEFALLKEMPFFKAKQVYFAYGSLDNMVNKEDRIQPLASKIMIGNSSSPESNQLDVLVKLKNLNLDFEQIVVPLSYGNFKGYQEAICKYGYAMFPNSFLPLTDFLPIEKYISLLKQCGVAVFNHERQQAVGNVIAMLYLGSRVFLSENNPLYAYLEKIGIIVFSIQNDFIPANLVGLDLKDAEQNRNIIKNNYAKEIIQAGIDETIRVISSDMKIK